MADTISVKMTGIDELNKKLEGLKYDVQRKGGRFALRKAAQVVRDAARQNAQAVDDSATGRSIAKNITEKWNGRLNKQTGDLGFRVGVQGGAKVPQDNADEGAGGPTPHWRLLEFGTEKMAARPFFSRALPENAQKATDVFIDQFGRAIDRALKKAG
jgi:HK97 gp10 family phage protein